MTGSRTSRKASGKRVVLPRAWLGLEARAWAWLERAWAWAWDSSGQSPRPLLGLGWPGLGLSQGLSAPGSSTARDTFALRSPGVYSPQMPRTTKTQMQSEIVVYVAENIMAASILLEDDPDDSDLMGLDEEEAELFADGISDVLELEALNWAVIAESVSGDGSQGPYNQIPKSVDFFSVCLRVPDREFRHMFRFVSASSMGSLRAES
ncbi:hypothetical protein B0H11DRAFT_1916545 [Mycena galericulata]|nr:hypothetical protein B0H11DRAFT_1916545 [Mycena galericulata]